jgi:MFS family permease
MSQVSAAGNQQAPRKLGMFWLMPDITPVNALTYFSAALLAIPMMAALSFLQPIMLKVVGIERAVQGTLTGDLTFYQECIVLLLVPFIGAGADKLGRKPILLLGFAFLGLGYAFYPFADSEGMMYAYRTVFAFGIAAITGTITIVSTDYVQDKSRGKWVAIASFTQGIGIFVASQLLRWLPNELAGDGLSEADIAKVLFWGCGGVCVLVFALGAAGLSSKKPIETREKDSLLHLLGSGMKAARANLRIGLAYGCAFAARGDVLVVGTFTFLWTQQAAEDLGLGMGDGYRRGGMIFGAIQFSALIWALIMGFILDKVDRTTGVIVAFALSAVGYTAFGLVGDPFSNSILLPAVILGMGESSTIIAGNALIGQSAPVAIRGAVLGLFSLCGAAGILIATSIGGRLFDLWMPGGPFVQMGIINSIVLTAAIYVRVKTGKQ